MARKVHFTGTCPNCGKPTKIYSQVEVRICRACIARRPVADRDPRQAPLPGMGKTNEVSECRAPDDVSGASGAG